jgi:prepilin-type N-terminal cleavage/methylation domain-containing protein
MMKRCVNRKSGVTLVEVLMSILLVGAAAAMIYEGAMYSYKTMMRSRARLSAQGIAFDKIWQLYNLQTPEELRAEELRGIQWTPTPSNSVFSTNGVIEWVVLAPNGTNYWNIGVWVYAYPTTNTLYNSDTNNIPYTADDKPTILFPEGRKPEMVEYWVRRSNRDR